MIRVDHFGPMHFLKHPAVQDSACFSFLADSERVGSLPPLTLAVTDGYRSIDVNARRPQFVLLAFRSQRQLA
jgi:hypothetical protein